MRTINHWNKLSREAVVSSSEDLFSSQTRCLGSLAKHKFLYSTEIPGLNSMVCNLRELREFELMMLSVSS